MATAATKATKVTKKSAPHTWLDDLRDAVADVDRARQSAGGEARERLDAAVSRLHDVVSDVRGRAEDQTAEFESALERASEHLRVELGLRAVRAQQTTEGLTALSSEIRKRKAALTK